MQLRALSPGSPLGLVLADIQNAINSRLYYPALLVALTIPEICTALTLDRSVFVKEKDYVAFVDKYTKPIALGLKGLDCYRLRGGVVHRANMAGHPKFDATHVVFTIPETHAQLQGFSIKTLSGKTAVMLDLVSFCSTMSTAADLWYEDHQHDAKVAENMKNLIRYCPNGLAPFFGGAPIVASGA